MPKDDKDAQTVTIDESAEMPTVAEIEEAEKKLATKKFMRCYSIRHGLNFNIRNDQVVRNFNTVGAEISKHVIDPGYTMAFVDHRCDVPIGPEVDVEVV